MGGKVGRFISINHPNPSINLTLSPPIPDLVVPVSYLGHTHTLSYLAVDGKRAFQYRPTPPLPILPILPINGGTYSVTKDCINRSPALVQKGQITCTKCILHF